LGEPPCPHVDVVLIRRSSLARAAQNIAIAEMSKFDVKQLHWKFY
jgi:hypothetical protein